MALIACPDCGTEISDQASACVKCGRPMPHLPNTPQRPPPPVHGTTSQRGFLMVMMLFVGVGLVGGAFILFGAKSKLGDAHVAADSGATDHRRDAVLRDVLIGCTGKAAKWTQQKTLWIGVINDGTRRDGCAQQRLRSDSPSRHHRSRDRARVGWVAMTQDRLSELGQPVCR